jgi:hypothetical protein
MLDAIFSQHTHMCLNADMQVSLTTLCLSTEALLL